MKLIIHKTKQKMDIQVSSGQASVPVPLRFVFLELSKGRLWRRKVDPFSSKVIFHRSRPHKPYVTRKPGKVTDAFHLYLFKLSNCSSYGRLLSHCSKYETRWQFPAAVWSDLPHYGLKKYIPTNLEIPIWNGLFGDVPFPFSLIFL